MIEINPSIHQGIFKVEPKSRIVTVGISKDGIRIVARPGEYNARGPQSQKRENTKSEQRT